MSRNERLDAGAYGGVTGDDYKPYVDHDRSVREFTLRAVVLGILLGIVFGASQAYLGLQVGMTVSASIPVAVIAIAISRGRFGRATLLENNMVQTIGSAGESLAAGVIFTIPALIVLGMIPELAKVFVLATVGGLLGVLFMIPLRRYLMVREHGRLPFPEGTACAEVLVAGERGGSGARTVMAGLGVAAVYQFLMDGLNLWPSVSEWDIRGVAGARIGAKVTPPLLGVGYVVGPKIAGIMLAGGALGWLVLIPVIKMVGQGLAAPIFPATVPICEMGAYDIWNNYIRYIGAGAVALGGVVTLVRAIPTMVQSFKLGLGEFYSPGAGNAASAPRGGAAPRSGDARRGGSAGPPVVAGGKAGRAPRTSRDLPIKLVLYGAIALAIVCWAAPQIPVGAVGALLIIVFAFFFVTVSSRIVGLIGSSSNPASGMTIATLLATSLVFLAMGWTGPAGMVAAISVGAVVCLAICIAGDVSQDLKTGFLVGATPWRQQVGEIIGVLSSALVIGWTVFFLHRAYGIGSPELPAPQAVLMSMVVKGVLTSSLPWTLVFIGAFIAGCVELLGVPSLPFAVGLYLPIRLSTPIMAGGIVRLLAERGVGEELRRRRRERGVLMSSGLIAGGGLVGILVAGLVNWDVQEGIEIGHKWAGTWAGGFALAMFAVLIFFLAIGGGVIGAPRRRR